MLLKTVLDLSKKIDEHRQDINTLSKNKGISHPDVIKMTQKLSEETRMMQNIIDSIRTLQNHQPKKIVHEEDKSSSS
jgi:cupin superfamily acireductone dioxygenase involved in methionine salvage